jgi:hypothetical protein
LYEKKKEKKKKKKGPIGGKVAIDSRVGLCKYGQ